MESIGEALAKALDTLAPVAEGDIQYCPVCGKPLEFEREVLGRKRRLPILCDCGKERAARQKEFERLALERKQLNELTGYSLMDSRALASTFETAVETPQNARALHIARRYVENWPDMLANNTGLLFYGPPGTGKTFLADCIANALLQRGVSVMVTSLLRLTATNDPETLTETISRMKAARLLVLDDFGAERDTSFKAEQVFNVIDSRYNSERPLIVTTNLSMAEMKGGDIRYQRIFDRVLNMCHPVKMDGESWRRGEVRRNYEHIRDILEG